MKVKRLSETAILPTRGSTEAAGLDLYADEGAMLPPGTRATIPTGVSVAIPEDMVGLIWPRSGMAVKHGIDVLAGVIDADYRGEIAVVLQNHGQEVVTIRQGDRIAQMIVQRYERENVFEVDELPASDRGAGGFGSTGK